MIERKTYIPFRENKALHSIDYLKGIIEDASVTTLQRIHNISTEELHWQYADNWNTIGALLSHIISCRRFFRIYFIEGKELNEAEKTLIMPGLEMGKHIPDLITGAPVEVYLKELATTKAEVLKSLDTLSMDQFHEKREGYNPKTGHNLAWTIYHLAEDEVHHRGQISLIRKLYKNIVQDKQ